MANGLTRRAGQQFDDVQVEDYAQSRAAGATIAVASQHAGFGVQRGKTLEQKPEVRDRIHELRQGKRTLTTVSPAWILEQLKQNAVDSGTAAREAEGRDAAALFKASNDALELCYDIVTTNEGVLNNIGESLPRAPLEMRAELRKRLSANSEAITTLGVSVESADESLQ